LKDDTNGNTSNCRHYNSGGSFSGKGEAQGQ